MCEIDRIIDRYFDGDDCKKKSVAEKSGIVYSTFARKTNPNDQLKLTIYDLIPYTLNTDFTLLDHIESRLGRVAFTIPNKDEDISLQSISKLATVSGAALSTMAESLEDGTITNKERIALNNALLALSQRVNIIMGKLNKA